MKGYSFDGFHLEGRRTVPDSSELKLQFYFVDKRNNQNWTYDPYQRMVEDWFWSSIIVWFVIFSIKNTTWIFEHSSFVLWNVGNYWTGIRSYICCQCNQLISENVSGWHSVTLVSHCNPTLSTLANNTTRTHSLHSYTLSWTIERRTDISLLHGPYELRIGKGKDIWAS